MCLSDGFLTEVQRIILSRRIWTARSFRWSCGSIRGAEVRQKYIRSINEIEEEVVGIVTLPADWRERGTFRLRAFYREQETKGYRIRRAGLLRLEQEISYYVESCRRSGDPCDRIRLVHGGRGGKA